MRFEIVGIALVCFEPETIVIKVAFTTWTRPLSAAADGVCAHEIVPPHEHVILRLTPIHSSAPWTSLILRISTSSLLSTQIPLGTLRGVSNFLWDKRNFSVARGPSVGCTQRLRGSLRVTRYGVR